MSENKPDDLLRTKVARHLAKIGGIGFPGDSQQWMEYSGHTLNGEQSSKSYIAALQTHAGFRDGKLRGWTRLAFSAEEDQVHEYAESFLRDNGFDTRVDSFGNLFGRKGNRDKPAIMLGTHLDTVRDGGNYDGVVGFIVAVESVLLAESKGDLKHPMEIAVFRAEESTRFKMACLGSQAAFGFLSQQKLRELVDGVDNHFSLADLLKKRGLDDRSSVRDSLARNDYLAYFETHIEQARTLEKLESIGLVTSIRAPKRRLVSVTGDRRVKAASAMILAIEWLARRHSYLGEDIVGTVGEVHGFYVGADKINAVIGYIACIIGLMDLPRQKLIESIGDAKGVRIVDIDSPIPAHRYEFIGQTAHSGGTPMGKSIRKDALVTACEVVLDVDDSRIQTNDKKIDFFIDLRSNSASTLNKVDARIDRELREIAVDFGVHCEIGSPFGDIEPISNLNESLRKKMKAIAEDLRIPCEEIPSGAGHDAMYAHKAGIPTGMIFVPSVDGLSHTPEEFTRTEDIVQAIVLQTAILELVHFPINGD